MFAILEENIRTNAHANSGIRSIKDSLSHSIGLEVFQPLYKYKNPDDYIGILTATPEKYK
jgi:hypothetical protein